jgi:hypothetical protein
MVEVLTWAIPNILNVTKVIKSTSLVLNAYFYNLLFVINW